MKKELVNKLFKGFYPVVDVDYGENIKAYSLAEAFLEQDFPILQLRQKSLSDRDFLDLAMEIIYLKIHNDFTFILNQHVDLVKKIGADGVHLTHQSMRIKEARKLLGDHKIIGKSVHSYEEAKQAYEEGVDYLSLAPIFPTSSKSKDYPLFPEEDRDKLIQELDIPLIAIGGINKDNLHQIKQMSFSGFCALSSSIHDQAGKTSRELQEKWNS